MSGLFVRGSTFVFLSHAVWAAAGPSGHHTADDQQRTEGQQHTAHTGAHRSLCLVFSDKFLTWLFCSNVPLFCFYVQVQQTMKENLVSVEENFAALDQRMKKVSK